MNSKLELLEASSIKSLVSPESDIPNTQIEALQENGATTITIEKLASTDTDETNHSITPYTYKNDSNNPKNWAKRKKFVCLSIVLTITFMPYFSSAIYVPAVPEMMATFDKDVTAVTSTFSVYLLMNGIAPLFWAPLSNRMGRKPVYISAMSLYTVFSVLCGVSTCFSMFITFRILQASCVSVAQGLGGGTIADICKPEERGRVMSYYIFSLAVSSSVGIVVGGFIAEYLGFRWIFYLLAMVGCTISIVGFLFLEETLYHDNIQNPRKKNPSLQERIISNFAFNPLRTLLLLKNPNVFFTSFQTGIAFGCYYFIIALLPSTFGPIYNFTPQQVGFTFVAGGIGSGLGSITAGKISDKYCAKVASKNYGRPAMEARLRLAFYVIPLVLIGMVMYGWFLHARVHWAVPLISLGICSYGILFTTTICVTFAIDSVPKDSASATALNNLLRSVFSMILSLVSTPLRDVMGDGWVYTFSGLVATITYFICTSIVIKYSEKWRESDRYK